MRILITGGAGFIGSNLAELLLLSNHQVTVVDNLITGNKTNINQLLKKESFNFTNVDITNFDFVNSFKNLNFEIIYHLASPASPIQYEKHPLETLLVNSVGTKNILDLAKMWKSKVIFASTSEVYGDPLIHPQIESYWGNVNSFGPRSCYDEAKRFAEALCYTYLNKEQVDIRIVRIFNTYGPKMEKNDGRVISNFIVQAISNKPLTVNGTGMQTRSCCYVSDLMAGLVKMSEREVTGEIVNLGNPEELTVLQIAQLIIKLTKSNSQIVFTPLPKDDPKKRKPNIEKAKSLLNWEPKVKIEEGLLKTIEYFRKVI